MIRTTGDVTWQEMFTTFNMGIGLVAVVPPSQVEEALAALTKHDEAFQIGIVEKAKQGIVDIKSHGVMIE